VTDTSKHRTDRDDFTFDQLREEQVTCVRQGDSYRDDNFPIFWKQAALLTGGQKVYRGPYHFLTANADGKKQADWFLGLLSKSGRPEIRRHGTWRRSRMGRL
jgi:GH25 family lysozyme M1 (1,4-beta-N-acetylmuramidase)